MTFFRFSQPIFPVTAAVSIACLAGCTPRTSPLAGRDPLRGIAASFLAGRAFDRAQLALQSDDNVGLERAGLELRRASDAGYSPRLTGAFVSSLSIQAAILAQNAEFARGDEMIELLENSADKYRAALAFAPEKSPEKIMDAQTLNSLGYFLADRGTTPADFARAVTLTRAALRAASVNQAGQGFDAVQRANVQDSFAWALFKQGKYEQARQQQEEAWDIVRGMGLSDMTGEIPFHLGEIYRALGRKDKARDAYRQAALLPSDSRTKAKIEGALRILDLAQV